MPVGSPDPTGRPGFLFNQKGSMPLRKRKFVKGNAYFITTSVNNFTKIFKETRYINILLENINFYRFKYGFLLLAYVIMPDHLHMLIHPNPDRPEDISSIMEDFKKFTSRQLRRQMEEDKRTKWLESFRLKTPKKRNWRYQVWQERFDDLGIYSLTAARAKINYIHSNPVRKGMVDKPEEYPYSSARNYILNNHTVIRVDTDFLTP